MINSGAKANYGDESPVAAFATTPGNSALTLIRCSGKGSVELASSVFAAARTKNSPLQKNTSPLKEAQGNTVIHGWIVSKKNELADNERIDDVLISVFRAPKSYTGEDSLDICCHGGTTSG
jgi:tRNA modification GTPase